MNSLSELMVGENKLSSEELKSLCFQMGADDVGFVSLDNPLLDDQRADIQKAFPQTRTLISIVMKMNREPIRATARSIANAEFHATGEETNEVTRKIVRALEDRGIRALNPAMGFPMEMDNFPGKVWLVSHKPVAVAAGLGQMGIHRNVIHPKFGNFILLSTILIEPEVTEHDTPIDFNPCLSCKLCVAACPVGAIEPDGYFNFSSCYTHNYREFMGGFTDWVEDLVDSKNARDYRSKYRDSESSSMWQSLSFGANYKAAYCLSVCPAGEDVIGPYLESKKDFLTTVVRPLQAKDETVYVVKGSDAEAHVKKRFPHKKTKRVGGLRPSDVPGFLMGLPLLFQRKVAKGWKAVYHFHFSGATKTSHTVVINNGELIVEDGIQGVANLTMWADADTWIKFLRKDVSMGWALLTRRIRLRGNPKLLLKFGDCFPS
ncbi:MAG TPA: 4Fe-4S ferredoxin [Phycisphaerales bacterium]|nr:4Fe-4S ferredoxin [Phycisphaerales bacterium]